MATVTRQAVHIKSQTFHRSPFNFTKFTDLHIHERPEEMYFKFMSFITDPADLVKGSGLSSHQRLRRLLNMSLCLALTSSHGLGLFGSSLSNSGFRTGTNKWFKFFCSSLEREFEIHLRRLSTTDHRNLGRSKYFPNLHLFPYGAKERSSLCQTDSQAPWCACMLCPKV